MSISKDISYKHNDIIHMSSAGRSRVFNVELVGLSICDPAYYVRRYKCKMYVFEYVYHGKGVVRINGVSCAPSAGDVYILTEGSDHEYYTDKKDKWRKVWFTASGLLIDQLMKAYTLNNVYWIQNIDIKHLFIDMFRTVKEERPDQHGITALLMHKIIMECAASIRVKDNPVSRDAIAVKKHLDANITKHVSLDAVARQVHKSPSQVIRIFKKAYSVTPYEYIVRERINSAKMLLTHHHFLSVKEVAFMLNFSDEHYFSNVFKNKVGMSPSMYKQMSLLDLH